MAVWSWSRPRTNETGVRVPRWLFRPFWHRVVKWSGSLRLPTSTSHISLGQYFNSHFEIAKQNFPWFDLPNNSQNKSNNVVCSNCVLSEFWRMKLKAFSNVGGLYSLTTSNAMIGQGVLVVSWAILVTTSFCVYLESYLCKSMN